MLILPLGLSIYVKVNEMQEKFRSNDRLWQTDAVLFLPHEPFGKLTATLEIYKGTAIK